MIPVLTAIFPIFASVVSILVVPESYNIVPVYVIVLSQDHIFIDPESVVPVFASMVVASVSPVELLSCTSVTLVPVFVVPVFCHSHVPLRIGSRVSRIQDSDSVVPVLVGPVSLPIGIFTLQSSSVVVR